MDELEAFIKKRFGVSLSIFSEALNSSPSANGYIMGAISELLLKEYLEKNNYNVLRIKEKPSGGNNAKNSDARGDFYIKKNNNDENDWFVIECKGLKSNAEFRGAKLDNESKLFKFLKPLAFPSKDYKKKIYDKGFKSYSKEKDLWESKNIDQKFPDFKWIEETAGATSVKLENIWKDEEDLLKWIKNQDKYLFSEQAYRKMEGIISILETHQPSNRISSITKVKQAAPLVLDFNIMAVDLFLRTGKHEFAFMNSDKISHSPTSPEHLYQNYTIDILIKGIKKNIIFTPPWYQNIDELINKTNPIARKLDESQLDKRIFSSDYSVDED